jgi:predicted metal-dependent hydrolase
MTDHILPGNPPIPLLLRRSAQARRISLRISQLDGRVTLTLPKRCAEAEALDFAAQKELWIRKHLQARTPDAPIMLGAQIPFQGFSCSIVAGQGRTVQAFDGEIAVPGSPERVAARLSGFLKQTARTRLASASDHYAAKLGRPYASLTIRDTRSRWGSCSAAGGLMYSWRLILAPTEVLNYVAAHEVAHLQEMNHSQAFWDVVQHLYGDYKDARGWLRREGADLHRFQF